MSKSPRAQKPDSQPDAAKVVTGPEFIGQMTEIWLCLTVPGYAICVALSHAEGVSKKKEHQAF